MLNTMKNKIHSPTQILMKQESIATNMDEDLGPNLCDAVSTKSSRSLFSTASRVISLFCCAILITLLFSVPLKPLDYNST